MLRNILFIVFLFIAYLIGMQNHAGEKSNYEQSGFNQNEEEIETIYLFEGDLEKLSLEHREGHYFTKNLAEKLEYATKQLFTLLGLSVYKMINLFYEN